MSCTQNEIAKKAAWEKFVELFETDCVFETEMRALFTHRENWREKELGREDEALERLFEALWIAHGEAFFYQSENHSKYPYILNIED